ncbi:Zinc Finger Protein 42 [Manis pentadactyla]|nr:Zinc Finger Protein 42 [Manis pentadactyla]
MHSVHTSLTPCAPEDLFADVYPRVPPSALVIKQPQERSLRLPRFGLQRRRRRAEPRAERGAGGRAPGRGPRGSRSSSEWPLVLQAQWALGPGTKGALDDSPAAGPCHL